MSAIKMHEPWRYSEDKEWIVDSYGDEVIPTEGITSSIADRIVACVNAMASIPDPAAFVKRAKALLKAMNEGSVNEINKAHTALAACAQQEKKV